MDIKFIKCVYNLYFIFIFIIDNFLLQRNLIDFFGLLEQLNDELHHEV